MKNMILISLLLAATGCYDPYAHEFTTQKPNKEQIVGVYVIHDQTMQHYAPSLENDLKNMRIPPTITISSDNSYIFHQVPSFEDEPDVMHPRFSGFLDIKGSWSIDKVGSVGDGSGKLEDHWGLHLTPLKGTMGRPGFMGTISPDRLIFTFSDPDSGEVLIFKKQ